MHNKIQKRSQMNGDNSCLLVLRASFTVAEFSSVYMVTTSWEAPLALTVTFNSSGYTIQIGISIPFGHLSLYAPVEFRPLESTKKFYFKY